MQIGIQRNLAIDMMKALAAIFIVNSHLIPMYKDINPALATFGVHGDAMFFFCAGYVALLGLKKQQNNSLLLYMRNRFQRLFPTIMIFFILRNLFFDTPITWNNLLYADGFWFISHIFISYIFVYLLFVYQHDKLLLWFWTISFIVIISALFVEANGASIFFNKLNHYCFFPSMLLGLILSEKGRLKNTSKDFIWMILSFVCYFLISSIGKGRTDNLYYIQILSFFPLNSFLYFAYKSFSLITSSITPLFIRIIIFISSLTLEMYMVHYSFITPKYNNLFLLNIIYLYITTIVSAYILRVVTNFYKMCMSNQRYPLTTIFKV